VVVDGVGVGGVGLVLDVGVDIEVD